MPEIVGLSASDLAVLRKLVHDFRSGRLNSPSKSPYPADEKSSDTYKALVPEGGIPARSGTAAGSGTCEVYRVDDDGELVATGHSELVYNISDAPVEAGSYVHILRDRYGTWGVGSVCCGGDGDEQDDCGAVLLDCEPGTGTGTGVNTCLVAIYVGNENAIADDDFTVSLDGEVIATLEETDPRCSRTTCRGHLVLPESLAGWEPAIFGEGEAGLEFCEDVDVSLTYHYAPELDDLATGSHDVDVDSVADNGCGNFGIIKVFAVKYVNGSPTLVPIASEYYDADGNHFAFDFTCGELPFPGTGTVDHTVECAANPEELMPPSLFVRFARNGDILDRVMEHGLLGHNYWEWVTEFPEGDPLDDQFVGGLVMACGASPGEFGFEGSTIPDGNYNDSNFGLKTVVDYAPFHMTVRWYLQGLGSDSYIDVTVTERPL